MALITKINMHLTVPAGGAVDSDAASCQPDEKADFQECSDTMPTFRS